MNYYNLIINGYEKDAGVISPVDSRTYPEILDGKPYVLEDDIIYELRDGKFCPFDRAPDWIRVVDNNLKALLETYAEKEYVEFIPITIRSEVYGDRSYYIMHFKKIYDVIDEVNTVYGPGGNIIKLRVDYEKVKKLHVFNSRPFINDLIVSTKVYKEIKKQKLNFGTSFGIVYCLNKPETKVDNRKI